MHEESPRLRTKFRWACLVGGPLIALGCYALLPAEYRDAHDNLVLFSAAGRATLSVMAWMALWWLSEAIDISATALLPLALFPLLGVAGIGTVAAPYANPLIFLFMGGFLLALSMQRWGLDRRIALLTLRIVGSRPGAMVAGFMLASAGLSMFVSNTATAAMMLPIGLSVIDLVMRRSDPAEAATLQGSQGRNFSLCLMLGIAYAASIGGVGTIIGTPPNALLVAFVRDSIEAPYRAEISFARWMLLALPLVVVFLPLVWLLLTKVLYPLRLRRIPGSAAWVGEQLRTLGPPARGEWITGIVFACTAVAWMTRPLLARIEWSFGGEVVRPLAGLSDAGIAMIAGMALFVIPVDLKHRRFTMDWGTATRLPWSILILFGGGLSLAAMVNATGVADFIGSLVGGLPRLPPLLLILTVAVLVIFLTELTSNTATTATLLPILAALAPGLGVHPYLLIVPAALAASCAFMLPVATPPNAIVFASGHVTIPEMCKAGFWLNLVGVVLVTLLTLGLVTPLLVPGG